MAKPQSDAEYAMKGNPRVSQSKPMHYWDSMVPSIVAQNFGQAKILAELSRMKECQARLDMLENDWKDLLLRKILKRYKSKRIRDSAADLITTEHNPLRRIVYLIASIYKWGATRELADKGANEIAKALWAEAEIDEFMALANARWVGLGDALIMPTIAAGRLKYLLWTGESTTIQQHPEDPSQCVWATHQEAYCHSTGVTQIRRHYVDALVWRITDQHENVISEVTHGMGRFPGVVVHSEHRTGGYFWGDHALRPVVETTLDVGIDMFRLERIMHFQSELQPTYQGSPKDIAKGMGTGAEFVWVGKGVWGQLNLQATPEHVLSVINRRLNLIAGQFDCDGGLYFGTVDSTKTSGFQLRVQKAPLEARRVADLKIARRIEKELLIVTALVSERFHPSLKLDSMKADLSVLDFGEEPMLEDPLTWNRVQEERRQSGLTSRVKMKRDLNPDLTREQALEDAKQDAIDDAEIDKIRIEHQSPTPGAPNMTPQQTGAVGGKTSGGGDGGTGSLDAWAEKALKRVGQ